VIDIQNRQKSARETESARDRKVVSPAVNGMIRPSAVTTITDCEPRMVAKLDQVRKLSGRRKPNSAIVKAHTRTNASRSNQSTNAL